MLNEGVKEFQIIVFNVNFYKFFKMEYKILLYFYIKY